MFGTAKIFCCKDTNEPLINYMNRYLLLSCHGKKTHIKSLLLSKMIFVKEACIVKGQDRRLDFKLG